MRIKKDLKHNKVIATPDDADDLWDLSNVIEAGDTVKASGERKINLGGSEEKSRVIKKRMTLTIEVEKVSYDQDLRILGKIIDGPDDVPRGSAHSFGITPGETITITKNWANYQLARLNDATKERNSMLVVLFDREQAIFMSVTGRGIETITEIKGNVNKKAVDETVKSNFYQEIVQTTKELKETKKPSGVVFASPAFWQEYIKKYVEGFTPIYTTISDVEKTAVRELVGRPELQKLLRNNRAALEIQYIEEIMNALAHDKLAYGDKDVKTAIEQANVKAVFLSQTRIHKEREEETFGATERLLRDAETAGGAVHIMSSTQSCRELDGLGGLVVVQRW